MSFFCAGELVWGVMGKLVSYLIGCSPSELEGNEKVKIL